MINSCDLLLTIKRDDNGIMPGKDIKELWKIIIMNGFILLKGWFYETDEIKNLKWLMWCGEEIRKATVFNIGKYMVAL